MFIERIREESVEISNPIKADHMDISSKQYSEIGSQPQKEIPTPMVFTRLDVSKPCLSSCDLVLRN